MRLIIALAFLAFIGSTTAFTAPQRTHQQQRFIFVCGSFFDELESRKPQSTAKATASHILIMTGADEDEAYNKLQILKEEIHEDPEIFAIAATKFSQCPSAADGGSLGEFGPGNMVEEFDEVVFNEQVGKVLGPIKTPFGYHLIYIHERRE